MAAIPSQEQNLDVSGMESVVARAELAGDPESFLAFARTLDSRTSWPGAQLQYQHGDHLIYGVSMRLRGAALTDITIEEEVGPVERREDGALCLRTAQQVTWPDGNAEARAEYLVLPPTGSGTHTLQFTYAYAPPSSKLVKSKHLPEFKEGMQVVSSRYLSNLVKAAQGA